MRNKVLIYCDYGCADVTMLEQGVRDYFEPKGCEVGFADAQGIIKDEVLNDDVLAFFMPEGAGTPFRRKLEVLGNDKIREYVRGGGMYYGICAGAYYACEQVVFEKDIPELAIVGGCGLNLVKGQAIGTLHKELGILPYAKNAASATVVDLIWDKDNDVHAVHYHGGPYFELDDKKGCEVLAHYPLSGNLPAVIKCHYGRGTVILSGVHYEDKGAELLKAVHHQRLDTIEAEKVYGQLAEKEKSRMALFQKIMAFSGR